MNPRHSVKASVGRWQKNKDILWYTRDKASGAGSVADEIAAVKAEEDRVRAASRPRGSKAAPAGHVASLWPPPGARQLMQEALGLRPRTEHHAAAGMGEAELKEFLKRGATGAQPACSSGRLSCCRPPRERAHY